MSQNNYSEISLLSAIPMIPGGNDVKQSVDFYARLGFKENWNYGDIAIVARGAVEIIICKNGSREIAEQTAFRIRVNGLTGLYNEFLALDPSPIHPNGKLSTKPWGTKEFAILDLAGVCITFFE